MSNKPDKKTQPGSPKSKNSPHGSNANSNRPPPLQLLDNTNTETSFNSSVNAAKSAGFNPSSSFNFESKANGNTASAPSSIDLPVPKKSLSESKRVSSPSVKELATKFKMEHMKTATEQAENGKPEYDKLENNPEQAAANKPEEDHLEDAREQDQLSVVFRPQTKHVPTLQEISQLQKDNATSFNQALAPLLKRHIPAPLLLPCPNTNSTNDTIDTSLPTILEMEIRHATAQAARNVYHAHIPSASARREFDFEYARIEREWFGRGSRVANWMRKLARSEKAKKAERGDDGAEDLDFEVETTTIGGGVDESW